MIDVNPYTHLMANYIRHQQGHSALLHFMFGGFVLWIPSIYYLFSPNHFYHL